MNVLPSSVNEISHFSKGSQLINKAATKNKFMSAAGDASVIHLATHAVVNFKEPENSYIAFYKQDRADTGYKMFAHELYNLQLPHTQFVFLSACETGSGKVSRSEGALSISRAFAFAGCPNIVTSLWKAEDKSTAYISRKFYNYVAEGYTYAQALQKAKTDLLADESMSQFHSPAYWSHLVFIGDVQEEKSATWLWIVTAGIVAIAALMIIYKRKKNI
jgi:CHAT domain-containing protein